MSPADRIVSRYGGELQMTVGWLGAKFPSRKAMERAMRDLDDAAVRHRPDGRNTIEFLEGAPESVTSSPK